jgi:hypothetical protein
MPVGQVSGLTLGRPMFDLPMLQAATDIDSLKTVLQSFFENLEGSAQGAGAPSPAKGSDTQYRSVYVNTDLDTLYAGKPTDPMNPDALSISGGGTPTQVTVWGIDPDGGHTLDTSGTSLTLTLQVKKYTFDAIDLDSTVEDAVAITYSTGTECS